MELQGWAIIQQDGTVQFVSKLPTTVSMSANRMHIYSAVLTYGETKQEPKKRKVSNDTRSKRSTRK